MIVSDSTPRIWPRKRQRGRMCIDIMGISGESCDCSTSRKQDHYRSSSIALFGTALAFASMYLAAGALTPLLVVYKIQWEVDSLLFTGAFAVYAIGFLSAALILGSLSDHVGRKPVLIGALACQLVSNILFLIAPGISVVIVGRTVQGVATGAAAAAFTALLVERAPAHRKRLGPILSSVAVSGGLALGSLGAGLLIQLTSSANTIIFIVLSVLTVLGGLAVALPSERFRTRPGVLRSMLPNIYIPPSALREFSFAAPAIAAVWMLAGLSGGLAPGLLHSVFNIDSGLLDGFAGFIAPAIAVITGLCCAPFSPRLSMTAGIYASIIAAILVGGGAVSGELAMMFLGEAVAGFGFGATFTAALALVVPLAAAAQRAGVVAGIYVVSQIGLGLPVVLAGLLSSVIGEVHTIAWYSCIVVLLSLLSLSGQRRLTSSLTNRQPASSFENSL